MEVNFINRIQRAAANRNLPIELRLSARMIIMGAVASFIGMIVCITDGAHPIAIGLTAFMALAIPVIYGLLLNTGHIRPLQYVMLISVVLVFPFLWIYGGGLYSGMNVWITFEILFFTVSLSGKLQKIAVVFAFLLYVGTVVLEKLGLWEYNLNSSSDKLLSIVASVMVVSAMVFYMSNYQKNLYNKEFSMVEEKNKELVTYAKEVERANAYQKIFLANMSHEVRSPMNVVLGFNRLILECDDIEEIHNYAKNIDNAGESLLVIINDILDYSKIEAGKMEMFPANYLFSDMVQLCKSSVEVQCADKGLDFVVEVDDTIPSVLYGDSVRVRQCTTNLLTNAMKYTTEGQVKLTYKNGGVSEDGKTVKLIISVSDTGRGITDEQKKELFTRFQRLDEGTNRSIEGTGLGLALTKSFLDMMGGKVTVDSTVGKGSTFTIEIDQKISDAETGFAGQKNSLTDEVKLGGMEVLVVDDSATNLVLMRRILDKFGVKADTADSGMTTLNMVQQKKYDLILMDHMMPGIDGVETYKRMKAMEHINKETPVVMLTANAMSGAMEEYISLGFNGYLSKPCKPEEIKVTLKQYARNR